MKRRINPEISVLYRYGQRFFASRLAELGLEAGQLAPLMQAYLHPGITQEQVSLTRGLDKGAVARSVKKLETAGFLRRESDETDRRVNRLYPTEKGLVHRAQVEGAVEELHTILYEGLTEEEIACAVRLIGKMKGNLEDYLNPPNDSKN